MGNKDQQKTAYGLLAVIWGITAAAKIFATEQFIGHVFGLTAGQGLLGLQRLAGFSSLAPAVAAYTLAVRPSSRPPNRTPPSPHTHTTNFLQYIHVHLADLLKHSGQEGHECKLYLTLYIMLEKMP